MAAESSNDRDLISVLDPDLSEDERLDALIAQLTLEEKVQCLGIDPTVPRLGIRASGHVEGLHGLALGGPGEWGMRGSGPVSTTTFPQAIGLAETWDPELVRRVAETEAIEARYVFHHPGYECGGLVVRAPNADLGRDPRWGRTEECYGEDPFLAATMAVAFVRGLQGDHPKYWRTAALLKHFLANSNEDEREQSSSDFDERAFREYYAWPFYRAIVEGGARAFMAAYNAYNGVPCAVHPVLREVAREQWGQDGIICTDGGAFRQLVSEHQAFQDLETAARATLRAGITQYLDRFTEAVHGALERGLIAEEEIDGAIYRNFRVMLRLGLLDPPERVPYAQVAENDPEPWASEQHRLLVRDVTRKSFVLLNNRGPLLPLCADKLRRVAVIGPLADRVLIDWYSGTPPYTVSAVEGIRRYVGDRVEVLASTNNDLSDAVRVARLADVAIVCVGNHPTGDSTWAKVTRPGDGKEAVDRRSLELYDEGLVERVVGANPKTVLVLISSFPFAITRSQQSVPAIVHVTHNSQELGTALAEVLFGEESPAGRLVQTWPRSLDALPPMRDYSLKGRTYRYSEAEPLYPFGYGLSYTTFAYRSLRAERGTIRAGETLPVSVEVANIGERRSDEVVQLYARFPNSRVPRPRISLVGFQRVPIDAGTAETVRLGVRADDLAFWDEARGQFVLEPGCVELLAGPSSASLPLATAITAVE